MLTVMWQKVDLVPVFGGQIGKSAQPTQHFLHHTYTNACSISWLSLVISTRIYHGLMHGMDA
jgi:hypothetical protein